MKQDQDTRNKHRPGHGGEVGEVGEVGKRKWQRREGSQGLNTRGRGNNQTHYMEVRARQDFNEKQETLNDPN